jgi:hypothetical protein
LQRILRERDRGSESVHCKEKPIWHLGARVNLYRVVPGRIRCWTGTLQLLRQRLSPELIVALLC